MRLKKLNPEEILQCKNMRKRHHIIVYRNLLIQIFTDTMKKDDWE